MRDAPVPAVGVGPDSEAASQSVPPSGTRWLRHVGTSSVVVRGPATRREYAFMGVRAVRSVDVRDVPHLLRTGLFLADR